MGVCSVSVFLAGCYLPVSRGPENISRALGLVEWSVPVGVDFVGPAVRGTWEARREIGAAPPDGRKRCYRIVVGHIDRS